jgi:hypothetical protein
MRGECFVYLKLSCQLAVARFGRFEFDRHCFTGDEVDAFVDVAERTGSDFALAIDAVPITERHCVAAFGGGGRRCRSGRTHNTRPGLSRWSLGRTQTGYPHHKNRGNSCQTATRHETRAFPQGSEKEGVRSGVR